MGLLIQIAEFELTDDPQLAQTRIPDLLETLEAKSRKYESIELLAKLPLGAEEQRRFEHLLLKELLSPQDVRKTSIIAVAARALVTRPDPDRFWDALYIAASVETRGYEFQSLLDALATLALARPEPRLSEFAALLRPRFRDHQSDVNTLCRAALALDLRSLAPEIQRFATSGPIVPDGEKSTPCKNTPEEPCHHRYHSSRHVRALWQETDLNTLGRMWMALLMHSHYEFTGERGIGSSLRARCHAAVAAASPEVRQQLVASARQLAKADSEQELPREIADWLLHWE